MTFTSILVRELILGLVLYACGFVFFWQFGIPLQKIWLHFFLLIFFLFLSGTVLFNYLAKSAFDLIGLVYLGFSFFNILILLFFLFLFLEPNDPDHRSMAIAGLLSYLTFFSVDTWWKLKWFFSSKK